MFNRTKISLEGRSYLDTTKYIKMAKKIKEEHENPPKEPDQTWKYLSNMKPGSVNHVFCNIKHYI